LRCDSKRAAALSSTTLGIHVDLLGFVVACGLNRASAMRAVLVVLLLAACRPPGYGKEPPPDAAATTDASNTTLDGAVDAFVAVCDHAFRLEGRATATSVWLTGNFINWAGDPQAGAVAFTLGNDGAWTGSYPFQAGTHQYKFIVNGTEWILDPTNPETVDDGMGHTNNVYTCVP
jgi:hypothetical protein